MSPDLQVLPRHGDQCVGPGRHGSLSALYFALYKAVRGLSPMPLSTDRYAQRIFDEPTLYKVVPAFADRPSGLDNDAWERQAVFGTRL